MSVAFVPERLRGSAQVNQDTLQRVSDTGLGRGRDWAETEPDGDAGPAWGRAGRAGAEAGAGGDGVCGAAAGGERPADPVHRGVPEQGPRHRLRAVSDPRGRAGRSAGGPGVGNRSETRLELPELCCRLEESASGLTKGFP